MNLSNNDLSNISNNSNIINSENNLSKNISHQKNFLKNYFHNKVSTNFFSSSHITNLKSNKTAHNKYIRSKLMNPPTQAEKINLTSIKSLSKNINKSSSNLLITKEKNCLSNSSKTTNLSPIIKSKSYLKNINNKNNNIESTSFLPLINKHPESLYEKELNDMKMKRIYNHKQARKFDKENFARNTEDPIPKRLKMPVNIPLIMKKKEDKIKNFLNINIESPYNNKWTNIFLENNYGKQIVVTGFCNGIPKFDIVNSSNSRKKSKEKKRMSRNNSCLINKRELKKMKDEGNNLNQRNGSVGNKSRIESCVSRSTKNNNSISNINGNSFRVDDGITREKVMFYKPYFPSIRNCLEIYGTNKRLLPKILIECTLKNSNKDGS